MFTIVAAVSKNRAIGRNNALPWKIPEDLQYFKKLTEHHVVIMGRKTFDSLKRPLPNRKNIVLTRQIIQTSSDNQLVFTDYENLSRHLDTDKTWFVIGGSEIYQFFMPFVSKLYITWVDKHIDADSFFPSFSEFGLTEYSSLQFSHDEDCHFRYLIFERIRNEAQEYIYLDLVKDILENGKTRPDRTGMGTIGVFGRQLRFDISESIPLLTSKFVSFDNIMKELLWFLKGDTDSKNLEKQGVNIWKGNSTRGFLDHRGLHHYEVGDIGPMYFFQVYHYNASYEGCGKDYTGKGYDQMQKLLEGLKNDPYSRRHLLTTYNPLSLEESVLAPCHGIVIQFFVEEDQHQQKVLSCHQYQRSVDVFLGLPYNIVSYSILTHIIAHQLSMKPGELIISTGDTHIYQDHIEQTRQQLQNPLYPFPRIALDPSIRYKNIDEIEHKDFELIGYFSNEAIRAKMAV